jgi:hypothetical protein
MCCGGYIEGSTYYPIKHRTIFTVSIRNNIIHNKQMIRFDHISFQQNLIQTNSLFHLTLTQRRIITTDTGENPTKSPLVDYRLVLTNSTLAIKRYHGFKMNSQTNDMTNAPYVHVPQILPYNFYISILSLYDCGCHLIPHLSVRVTGEKFWALAAVLPP